MWQPTGALMMPCLSQPCQALQARLRKRDCASKNLCKHNQNWMSTWLSAVPGVS